MPRAIQMPTDEALNNTSQSPEVAALEHEARVAGAVPVGPEPSPEVAALEQQARVFGVAVPLAAALNDYGPELPYDTMTRLNADKLPVQPGEEAIYVCDRILTDAGWLLNRARAL